MWLYNTMTEGDVSSVVFRDVDIDRTTFHELRSVSETWCVTFYMPLRSVKIEHLCKPLEQPDLQVYHGITTLSITCGPS